MTITRLGIVGAGQMGRGIAQIAALAGLEVRLLDERAGAVHEALGFVARMLGRMVEKGAVSAEARDAALHRLGTAARTSDLAGCDVVVEAVIEDLAVKRAIFAGLEDVVSGHAILASNTSSLSIAAIAAACRRPERVAGFHFFNPVPLMKLVEVVRAPRTDPAVIETLAALAAGLGHTAVRVEDSPGFLVNHAGRGYVTEALRIVQEGVCRPVDVDRVMRDVAGFPLGPFELLDLTALDVSDPVMRAIYEQFSHEPRFRPSPITATRLAAGLLGRKSGEGFYRYVEGRAATEPEPAASTEPPKRVWIASANPVAHAAVLKILEGRVAIEERSELADLCIVTPAGTDTTQTALAAGTDPTRTLAIDTLLPLDRRLTLMTNPATRDEVAEAARALFLSTGRSVTLIEDSCGLIVPRILAHIVNIACEIAQQRIAAPADVDLGCRLGLGYPLGPLAWGDALGPARVLGILEEMQRSTGDMRYRPSLWLRRRAALGLSLLRA